MSPFYSVPNRKKHKTHVEAMRDHFKRRVYERYGLVVNTDLYNRMSHSIRALYKEPPDASSGPKFEVQFLSRISHSRAVFLLHYAGCVLVVVYHSHQHKLITALPKDCREVTDAMVSADIAG